MRRIVIIICYGILLIPVLLICFVSKKWRLKFWTLLNDDVHTYPALPDSKIDQLFTLCVNFLLILGKRIGLSYNEVNIWIFCVIWPILTLVLFVLAIL
jgi:hypothetical protein